MLKYELKLLPEIVWAGVVAGVTVAAQVLTTTDFSRVEDWQTWGIALAAAIGRAVLGAVIQIAFGKGPEILPPPGPTP